MMVIRRKKIEINLNFNYLIVLLINPICHHSMSRFVNIIWHSLYFNVNAALLHFSTLKEIMNEFRSRKGVKTLTDYLNDKELVGYLVWTSLRLLLFYAAGRKVFFLVWSLKDGRNGWKVFEVDGRAKVDSLSKSGRSWAKLDGHFSQGERS